MERFPPLRCGKLSIGIKTGIAKQTAEREFFRRSGRLDRLLSSVKHLVYLGVVNTQELVCGSNHVHLVELPFGAFFVKELVNRLISRFLLEVSFDHQEQSPAQVRRTTLLLQSAGSDTSGVS